MKQAHQRLDELGAYPFERLKTLLAGINPPEKLPHIDAGAGEPRLPLPPFVSEALNDNLSGFSRYPGTKGSDMLRRAIAD